MKKCLTFIVFLMLLSFTFFPIGESAETTITYEDWDSYNTGVFSGNNAFVSWERSEGDDFIIVDTTEKTVKSPPNCLRVNDDDVGGTTGYINITDSGNYADGLMIYLRVNLKRYTWPHVQYINFYNATDVAIIKLCIANKDVIGDGLYYYHSTSGWLQLVSVSNPDNANWIYVVRHNETLHGNGCDYNIKDGSVWHNITSVTAVTDDWTDIAYIKTWSTGKIDSGHLGYIDVWFDDIIAIKEVGISEEECDYSYMPDRYSYLGNINSYCSIPSYKKTIETRYNIPVDMDITGVDLAVPIDQYNDDPVLSNYFLTFNGLYIGFPECFIEYSNYYLLRWEINVDLDNEIPILEFTHTEKTSYGRYWFVTTGCYSDTDLDNDGEVNYKESTTADGVYNGQNRAWDLAYQMYYENIQFPDDETYFDNDYIFVTNETLYCGDPVWLTYMLTSMATDTYVRIWNDDTSVEVNDGTFPYTCPTTSETIGFVTDASANYTAKLYRNSVELDNDSFFVNDFTDPNNYVYTTPNPCYEGESYLVKYAYDNTDNYDGAIFLSNTPDYRNYFEIFYILDGETGSFTQLIDAPCTLYYILAVDKNSTYYVTNDGVHQHTVKSRSMKNYFTLGNDNLALVDGKVTQSINGETTHIGGNCKIYDNNKLVYTITESTFNEFYTVTTTGMHKVEMRLITNETTVLYTLNYTVSGISEDDEIEDTSYILWNWLYENYGDMGVFLAGVLVVIGFMFIPFALVLGVNVKYNKNIALGDLHWSVYLIFAIVGVIVDVQLHLAELWIILLVCVVSIAITVITWKGNR